ncbi:hypothetical protein AB0283_13580 [Micromonospora vinacea]
MRSRPVRSAELIDGKVASSERHLAAGASGDPWQQQPRPAPEEHTHRVG